MEQATEKTGPAGTWFVIIGPFGRFIGISPTPMAEICQIHQEGGSILASDAFELSSQMAMQPVPHPTMPDVKVPSFFKQNLAFRVDAMLETAPVRFATAGTLIYFLDDLNESDATEYQELIRDAVRLGEGWRRDRLAQKSGVVAASVVPPKTSRIKL